MIREWLRQKREDASTRQKLCSKQIKEGESQLARLILSLRELEDPETKEIPEEVRFEFEMLTLIRVKVENAIESYRKVWLKEHIKINRYNWLLELRWPFSSRPLF